MSRIVLEIKQLLYLPVKQIVVFNRNNPPLIKDLNHVFGSLVINNSHPEQTCTV